MQKKQVFSIILVVSVFLIYTLPYIILRQNTIIPAWDNLDSYFIWYKVISKYGWFLPIDFKIPEFLDGTPKNVFHSELIFQVAIFNFLTPLKAYITIDLLGRIIGFFGMFLLLKDYILKKENENTFLLSSLALCFAFVPNFLTLTFLTILGVPLWLWAFLNIREQNYKYYNWLIITLIPFGVNFELITPFFLIFVGFIWLFDLIFKRKANPIFLLSIFICAFVSLITIYRFIYISFFDKNFISHRNDWSLVQIQIMSHKTFWISLLDGIKQHLYFNGEVCSHGANKAILFPVTLFALIYSGIKRQKEYFLPILKTLSIMIIFSMIYGLFFFYKPFQEFLDTYKFLQQFQLSRFYFMLPMLWVVIFALSIKFIKDVFSKFGKYIIYIPIFAQIIYLFTINPYFPENINKYILGKKDTQPTYREYLAEEQFRYIKNFIGHPQSEYKIAVIGELPYNVPSYNGFHSINGYFNLYSWKHKRKLNQMNAYLISKHPMYRLLLFYWGHQQLIYWDERLFNSNVMKKLGTKYLFSDRPIYQVKNTRLKFINLFPAQDFNTKYNIYVYELIN